MAMLPDWLQGHNIPDWLQGHKIAECYDPATGERVLVMAKTVRQAEWVARKAMAMLKGKEAEEKPLLTEEQRQAILRGDFRTPTPPGMTMELPGIEPMGMDPAVCPGCLMTSKPEVHVTQTAPIPSGANWKPGENCRVEGKCPGCGNVFLLALWSKPRR